ncbi:uncharacterized protein A4U43_C07F23020 [Asparagus officinalis]|uniref:Uncharacterized protein n=1 Tax=Asparagus officinalis TaxID=4686 RepID=A0A5P1EE69_ASPOF|nr:uncharacterized protein LOC109849690 [Asparagus officinalis]ONK64188.1 uncharacterized protein A4U43_C07F23020 [Asparagus officinalis]
MDHPKKTPISTSKSHLGSQRIMGFGEKFNETDENKGHPQTPIKSISGFSKKKVLGERNPNTQFEKTPKEKPAPYDPVKNYTSPRPAFLRYNPDRRREILCRMRDEEGSLNGSEASQNEEKSIEEDLVSVSSTSPKPSSRCMEEDEEADEEEVEERRPWCFGMVWKFLTLFGLFLFSPRYLSPMNSSTSSPFQENIPSFGNSMYRDLLKTHLGFCNVCLDVGEEMCGIEGSSDYLPVLDDSVMGNLGDSVKVNGVLDLEEKEFISETEFLEEREEPVNSYESLEQKKINQRKEIGEEEIFEEETIENLSASPITSESVEDPDDQFLSEELVGVDSKEGAKEEESMESIETDFKEEEPELQSISEGFLKWKQDFDFASKDFQLLLLFLSLLAAVIGLVIVLFKYFTKSHQKSTRTSSPSPVSQHNDKTVDEHEESLLVSPLPSFSMIEELKDEKRDSNVEFVSPKYSADELTGFYETRPPTVELLGEFSIVDALASKAASGQNLKSMRFEEYEISKSKRRSVSNNAQVSEMRIKSSTSSIKVQPYTQHPTIEKKEDIIDKSEAKKVIVTPKKVIATPLRRSSRLQNRVTSPTP